MTKQEFLTQLQTELGSIEGVDLTNIVKTANDLYDGLETEKTKVIANRDDILGQLKTAKDTLKEKERDGAELTRLREAEKERLENPGTKVNTDEIKKSLERTYTAQIDKLKEQVNDLNLKLQDSEEYINKEKIESALKKIL